jgi:hypothetical protein
MTAGRFFEVDHLVGGHLDLSPAPGFRPEAGLEAEVIQKGLGAGELLPHLG